jgi:CelD/BcsL family acetyltransferase involved in cellulose biosynthesis
MKPVIRRQRPLTRYSPVHPLNSNSRLNNYVARLKVYTSAQELEKFRGAWQSLCSGGQGTIFQNFDWNLLAARTFTHEKPFVVHAETSYGQAIIPAVFRSTDQTVRLLGEELFDYRGFLHQGDESVLRSAVAALSQLGRRFELVAVRAIDRRPVMQELQLTPFTLAPSIKAGEMPAASFATLHNRLARNLRRFQRLGFTLQQRNGASSELVRNIYEKKAASDPSSLFRDPARIHFMVEAARLNPDSCAIYTLENNAQLAAALVTLRDDSWRRFYTCWFAPELSKLSPAMTLLHEATRQTLADGMNCDYMTGEQPYKMRLATSSMPLYRLQATPQQLAAVSEDANVDLRLVG